MATLTDKEIRTQNYAKMVQNITPKQQELELDERPKAASTEDTLSERGLRYGKFSTHAQITQSLMSTSALFVLSLNDVPIEQHLSQVQLEALHMIYHKIGRILNGDPNYADSWDDISGYARLVADDLREKGYE